MPRGQEVVPSKKLGFKVVLDRGGAICVSPNISREAVPSICAETVTRAAQTWEHRNRFHSG